MRKSLIDNVKDIGDNGDNGDNDDNTDIDEIDTQDMNIKRSIKTIFNLIHDTHSKLALIENRMEFHDRDYEFILNKITEFEENLSKRSGCGFSCSNNSFTL